MEVRRRDIDKGTVPIGALLLEHLGIFRFRTRKCYQVYVLVLTFLIYTSYHMSRKPFSVVASVLAPHCSSNHGDNDTTDGHTTCRAVVENVTGGWPPFNDTFDPRNNHSLCRTLIGGVDYAWAITYAVFLVLSGVVADRVSLRYFLTAGMIGSGALVGIFGMAYFGDFHWYPYFIMVQIGVGVFESTGWPGTVAVMGNWFGKKHRGTVLGIWKANTSVGNILGTFIPVYFARGVGSPWGWSFIVPALVIIFMGAIVFLFLVTDPTHVGLKPPKHHLDKNKYSFLINEPSPNYRPIRNADEARSLEEEEDEEKDDEGEEEEEEGKKATVSPVIPITTDGVMRMKPVSLLTALRVPGVIEYSLALFFSKLVSYTFLFWLPYYIVKHKIGETCLTHENAAYLALLFDVGGIAGSISTGLISDLLGARAISCVLMMYLAVPMLFLYRLTGPYNIALSAVLILLCGLFINGPYALITTAVSNDLGTHKVLKDNLKAKATIAGIINATGSIGAAFGPLFTGLMSDNLGWDSAFYLLMFSCFLASLMLSRLLFNEVKDLYKRRKLLMCYRCCTSVCKTE